MADTDPVIPSAEGTIGKAGTQPDPLAGVKALEVSALAILKAEWEKKGTRDTLATILFAILGAIFPGAPQAILLTQLKPIITRVLETGSK